MKYKNKPVVIEAVCLKAVDHNGRSIDGWPFTENPPWLVSAINDGIVRDKFIAESDYCHIEIETLEGVMLASPGDFLIRGVNGEIYPCKPDIFEKTYDIVEPANQQQ